MNYENLDVKLGPLLRLLDGSSFALVSVHANPVKQDHWKRKESGRKDRKPKLNNQSGWYVM